MERSSISSEINELKIVFIYDRLSCRHEEDDPQNAILYFHPPTISIEKRVAICGQLMGMSHFFNDIFSAPKILTLANGKFAIRNFGKQYVLALGCSSVTSDWLLEKEADILEDLIKFFHCDIATILKKANNDRELLSDKLAKMMDHYIPISQHHGDLFSLTFGILPILHLPKSANNISLQASVLLQTCLLNAGVLGGIVMYQNKVVGVELSQSLAQKLSFIQPYRMPPADAVETNFKLPVGVQIFRVYITESEFRELCDDSNKFQEPQSVQTRSYERTNVEKNCSMIKNLTIEEEEVDGATTRPESEISSGVHSVENGFESLSSQTQEESDSQEDKGFENNSHHLDSGFSHSLASSSKPRRCQSELNFQDLHENEEFSENLSKVSSSSISDPTFPYVSNGKAISFFHSSSVEDSCLHNSEELTRFFKKDKLSNSASTTPSVFIKQSSIEPVNNISVAPPLTPSSLRRPVNLPLLIQNNENPKKKAWSNFPELISPLEESSFTFNSVSKDKKETQKLKLRLINNNAYDDEECSSSYSTGSETDGIFLKNSIFCPPLVLNPKVGKSQESGQKKSKENTVLLKKNRIKDSGNQEVVALYIYYDGSMRLLLLLHPHYQSNQLLINSLSEYVSSCLIELKSAIKTMEEQSSFNNQSDPYCFLRYESIWKSLAHGGRNESMDFNTVQFMHRDFTKFPNTNELIIRRDDHVVYGYQCVGSEVYYQQRAGLQPGLPMPSDLMGKVPLKAKRRLERDHSIVLL